MRCDEVLTNTMVSAAEQKNVFSKTFPFKKNKISPKWIHVSIYTTHGMNKSVNKSGALMSTTVYILVQLAQAV